MHVKSDVRPRMVLNAGLQAIKARVLVERDSTIKSLMFEAVQDALRKTSP